MILNTLAFCRKNVVQFKRNLFKTKMNITSHLDGSEQSMIPILKLGMESYSRRPGRKLVQLEEFSAGTGISDLTLFNVNERSLRNRRNMRPVTGRNHMRVLTAIVNQNGVNLEEVVSKTKLSKPTVSKIIDILTQSNIVVTEDNLYYSKLPQDKEISDDIVAIEAKVRDWKSGLRQAMRYREYADYSYLAIYDSHVKNCLNNIHIFEQLGIGLIGVSDEGVKIHLDAQKSTVTMLEYRQLAIERMLSAIDSRYETYVARNGFVANHS